MREKDRQLNIRLTPEEETKLDNMYREHLIETKELITRSEFIRFLLFSSSTVKDAQLTRDLLAECRQIVNEGIQRIQDFDKKKGTL